MSRDTRIVGERGQITIPKELRERFGIRGGDEVVVRAEEDRIVIAQRTVDDRMAEGYAEQVLRDRAVARDVSSAEEVAVPETVVESSPENGSDDVRVPGDAPAW